MTQPKPPVTVMEAIDARRSVRSYASVIPDRTTVASLLAAAVRAPTAVHQEPWAFVVLQDAMALKRISDRAKPLFVAQVNHGHIDRGGHSLDAFASPDFNIFYNAGTLIVICAASAGPFVVADCWLAAENLMLAACAVGLGTCVIGSSLMALNLSEVKAELGIPAEFSAVAPMIVGVPRGETPLTPRKEPRVLTWK